MSPHIGLLLRSRVLSKLQGVGKDVRSGRLELHGTTTTNVNDHAGQLGKNIEGGKEEKSCYFQVSGFGETNSRKRTRDKQRVCYTSNTLSIVVEKTPISLLAGVDSEFIFEFD